MAHQLPELSEPSQQEVVTIRNCHPVQGHRITCPQDSYQRAALSWPGSKPSSSCGVAFSFPCKLCMQSLLPRPSLPPPLIAPAARARLSPAHVGIPSPPPSLPIRASTRRPRPASRPRPVRGRQYVTSLERSWFGSRLTRGIGGKRRPICPCIICCCTSDMDDRSEREHFLRW